MISANLYNSVSLRPAVVVTPKKQKKERLLASAERRLQSVLPDDDGGGGGGGRRRRRQRRRRRVPGHSVCPTASEAFFFFWNWTDGSDASKQAAARQKQLNGRAGDEHRTRKSQFCVCFLCIFFAPRSNTALWTGSPLHQTTSTSRHQQESEDLWKLCRVRRCQRCLLLFVNFVTRVAVDFLTMHLVCARVCTDVWLLPEQPGVVQRHLCVGMRRSRDSNSSHN
jgi:hypothetical protein